MKQPPDAPENQTRLAALVAAHLDLVYAAALRQVRDPHHAEDITQSVFLLAATKAPHVPPERMGGWLIIATRHVTLAALRADRRRRKHERAAAAEAAAQQTMQDPPPAPSIDSSLDEALASLSESDRELIILRYLRNYPLPQLAALLGITDNTASKRVARALDKLRRHFRRRGIYLTPAALAAALPAASHHATAPHTLAARILAARPTQPAASASIAFRLRLVTTSAKVKVAAAAILFFIAAGIYVTCTRPAPPAVDHVVRNHFPDGGQVELLAVSNAADAKTWWSPDGSPLSRPLPGADFSDLKDPFGLPRATYQFALRLTDLPGQPQSVYLILSHVPRTASPVRLRRDAADPTLYYGAALLDPDQVETGSTFVAFSSLAWNYLSLDTDGHPRPPLPDNLPRGLKYLPSVFLNFPFSQVREKDGRTLLQIGTAIWLGDYEFTVSAIAKDGSSHPSTNLFTGLIAAGDDDNLAFDLRPADLRRFDAAIRRFDQFVQFAGLSLRPGRTTRPHPVPLDGPGDFHLDDAFYNQLFARGLVANISHENVPAAARAASDLLAELDRRRTHLLAEHSPNVYLVDRARPIVAKIHDALTRNDLAAATGLLQADTPSGQQLHTTMQFLAQLH